MPFFSIIIPTYNRADLLPRCIDSVLSQTFSDYEIVVVDNYSTDGTKSIVEDYISKDGRIRLVQVHNNGVISFSRNTGVKMSSGQYICFLDSDDWFAPTKLEELFRHCNSGKYDLLYHLLRGVSARGEENIIGRKINTKKPYYDLLINGCRIANSSVCVKKTCLEMVGYLSESPDLRTVEDTDCWLKIANANGRFFFINKILGYYWVGDNLSLSVGHIQQIVNFYNKYIPLIDCKYKRSVECRRDYSIAMTYQAMGYGKEARCYYRRALVRGGGELKLKALVRIIMIKFNSNQF